MKNNLKLLLLLTVLSILFACATDTQEQGDAEVNTETSTVTDQEQVEVEETEEDEESEPEEKVEEKEEEPEPVEESTEANPKKSEETEAPNEPISVPEGNEEAVVNDNIPYFSNEDITSTEAYHRNGPLDSLGRVTAANAVVGVEIMPAEERGILVNMNLQDGIKQAMPILVLVDGYTIART